MGKPSPRPRRIAYLLPDLAGVGTTVQGMQVCEGLERAGYAVDLVVAQRSGALADEPARRLRVVPLTPRDRIVRGPRRHARELRLLVRYLQRSRPAVLICGAKSMNLKALAACTLAGLPTRLVLTVTNDLYHGRRHTSISRWLSVGLIRATYGRADQVVALSQAMADDLVQEQGLPPERVSVIPPPIDSRRIDRLASVEVNHPWLASKQEPVVLAVGRLAPQKGYDVLLEAFAAATRIRPMRLLVLGDGAVRERARLVERCRDLAIDGLVSFCGFDSNPYRFMHRADLFVLASAWEGFGIVLAEALACGCPVVATDCRYGPREILEDGRFGRLVAVGDVQGLADALLAQLDSSPCESQLRQRSAAFGIDRISDRYDALISHLVG